MLPDRHSRLALAWKNLTGEDNFWTKVAGQRRAVERPTQLDFPDEQAKLDFRDEIKVAGATFVYRATLYRQGHGPVEVAAKRLMGLCPTVPSMPERWRGEMNAHHETIITKFLSWAHPSFVKFVAVLTDNLLHEYWLCTELADGPPLRQLTEHHAASAFRDLVLAVHFLRQQRPPIFHRDIKPDNVLVFREPVGYRAKLLDFGTSYAATEQLERLVRPAYVGSTEDDLAGLASVAKALGRPDWAAWFAHEPSSWEDVFDKLGVPPTPVELCQRRKQLPPEVISGLPQAEKERLALIAGVVGNTDALGVLLREADSAKTFARVGLEAAMANAREDVVEMLQPLVPREICHQWVYCLAARGHMHLVKRISGNGDELSPSHRFSILNGALIWGEPMALRWALGLQTDCREDARIHALHWAAEMNSVRQMEAVIQDMGSPSPECALSVLCSAARRNSVDAVKFLLSRKDRLKLTKKNLTSALFEAAQGGCPHTMTALLAAGADPGARTADGQTPLFVAVLWAENIEAVKLLVDCNVDLEGGPPNVFPPLVLAALMNWTEAVRLLLKAQAPLPYFSTLCFPRRASLLGKAPDPSNERGVPLSVFLTDFVALDGTDPEILAVLRRAEESSGT